MESTEIKCEFCKKIFSSKSNLSTHKKTAKYCISQHGTSLDDRFICTYCDKNLVTKSRLTEHEHKCKQKDEYFFNEKIKEKEKSEEEKLQEKDKIITELKQQVADLQTKLYEVAVRPPTSSPTTTITPTSTSVSSTSTVSSTASPKTVMTVMTVMEKMNEVMGGMGGEEKIEINKVGVECRRLDYYVNGVQLCRAAGKKVKDFLSLETTK